MRENQVTEDEWARLPAVWCRTCGDFLIGPDGVCFGTLPEVGYFRRKFCTDTGVQIDWRQVQRERKA